MAVCFKNLALVPPGRTCSPLSVTSCDEIPVTMAKSTAPPIRVDSPPLTQRQYFLAYAAQLSSFVTQAIFNFLLPLQVGPKFYGQFVAAFSLSFMLFAAYTPGFTLAVLKQTAGRKTAASDNRQLLQLLLVPTGITAFLLMLFGMYREYLIHDRQETFLYAGFLLLVLVPMHFLDSIMSAQNRNGEALVARVISGFGIIVLPAFLIRIRPLGSSVLLAVSLAYLISLLYYTRVLRTQNADDEFVNEFDSSRFCPKKWRSLMMAGVNFSAVSLTSTMFASAVLLGLSTVVQPEELAGLKIALALPTAVLSVLPFPEVYVYSTLQRAAVSEGQRQLRQRSVSLLAWATALAFIAALVLHVVGPIAVPIIFGARYDAARVFVGTVAWLVVPLALERPLLAVLSTRRDSGALAPYYVGGFAAALAAPLASVALLGTSSIASGLVAGRTLAVLIPAALLLREAPAQLAARTLHS